MNCKHLPIFVREIRVSGPLCGVASLTSQVGRWRDLSRQKQVIFFKMTSYGKKSRQLRRLFRVTQNDVILVTKNVRHFLVTKNDLIFKTSSFWSYSRHVEWRDILDVFNLGIFASS